MEEKNRFDDFEHVDNTNQVENNRFENPEINNTTPPPPPPLHTNTHTTTNYNYNDNLPPIGGGNETIPNSVGVLVLGILSIVACFCYGFVGLIMGIISLVLAKKALEEYNINPNRYSQSSYKNVKTGKILAYIGLACSALYILFLIIMMIIGGAGALTNYGSYY